MELTALQTIAQNLHEHDVRYLVAGGTAVVAHGYGRMTFDIDIVLKLEPHNVLRAFEALAKAGYRPRVPVTAEQFADGSLRQEWISQKGMVVLNMWSDVFRDTPIALFVTEPFDFDKVEREALVETLEDDVPIRFVSVPFLIAMKRAAGREKDLDDIRHLEMLADDE